MRYRLIGYGLFLLGMWLEANDAGKLLPVIRYKDNARYISGYTFERYVFTPRQRARDVIYLMAEHVADDIERQIVEDFLDHAG